MELHPRDGCLQEVACAAISNCLSSPTAREITVASGLSYIVAAMKAHGSNIALLENACSCLGAVTVGVAGRVAVMQNEGLVAVYAAMDKNVALQSIQVRPE